MGVTNSIQGGSAISGLGGEQKSLEQLLTIDIVKLRDAGLDPSALIYCRDNKIYPKEKQREQIKKAVKEGVNSDLIVKYMLTPLISADNMREVRACVRAGVDLDGFKLDSMKPEDIRAQYIDKITAEGELHANAVLNKNNTCIFEVYKTENSKVNSFGTVVLNQIGLFPANTCIEWDKPVSHHIINSVKSALDAYGLGGGTLEKCENGCSLYNAVSSIMNSAHKEINDGKNKRILDAFDVFENAGVGAIEYKSEGQNYTMPMPQYKDAFINSDSVVTAAHFLERDKSNVISECDKFIREFDSKMTVSVITPDKQGIERFNELEQKYNAPITSIACDNVLWINVTRCTDSDIRGIFIKEVGAKMGIEELLGKEVADEFFKNVWESAQNTWSKSENMPNVKEIINNVNTKCAGYSQEAKGIEFVKEFAQTAQIRNKLTPTEKGVWAKIKNAVKKLMSHRFKLNANDLSNCMPEKTLEKVIIKGCEIGLEMRHKVKMNLVMSENQLLVSKEPHLKRENKQEKQVKKGMKVSS